MNAGHIVAVATPDGYGGFAQPAFRHTSHHGLSTFRRQGSILVGVHSVSPWTLKLRNFSFLGPDRMDDLLKAHI